jgi:hypothetical protein
LTFDVVGDLGEEDQAQGVAYPNNFNPGQTAIDDLMGQSGARFVLQAGGVSYSGGTETDYGDLQQTGSEVKQYVRYVVLAGGLPAFSADGNHGPNVAALRVWPESATAAAAGGVSAEVSYPASAQDGTSAATYPNSWYAFSSGNVRIYVLDAAWADSNVGTVATGTDCGLAGSSQASACAAYQVQAENHWTVNSAEYQRLEQDLASHPGGIKFAVIHYPLSLDIASQPGDDYLDNTPANPTAPASLDALLANNGVDIAFNGHAHIYQRSIPTGAGQVISYTSGGGGAVLEPLLGGSTCNALASTESVYALGWSPTSGAGSSCNAPRPQSAAQGYNFLKVTVAGDQVTVRPTNAAGLVFDQQIYPFGGAIATPAATSSPTPTPLPPPRRRAAGASIRTAGGRLQRLPVCASRCPPGPQPETGWWWSRPCASESPGRSRVITDSAGNTWVNRTVVYTAGVTNRSEYWESIKAGAIAPGGIVAINFSTALVAVADLVVISGNDQSSAPIIAATSAPLGTTATAASGPITPSAAGELQIGWVQTPELSTSEGSPAATFTAGPGTTLGWSHSSSGSTYVSLSVSFQIPNIASNQSYQATYSGTPPWSAGIASVRA